MWLQAGHALYTVVATEQLRGVGMLKQVNLRLNRSQGNRKYWDDGYGDQWGGGYWVDLVVTEFW